MSKLVMQNCTVELDIGAVNVFEFDGKSFQGKVRAESKEPLFDVVIRCPDGRVVTIKKMLVKLAGTMLPVLDETCARVVLFTVDDGAVPDEPVVV